MFRDDANEPAARRGRAAIRATSQILGKVRNDHVAQAKHRPDGQNPIALQASPENTAQAWLQRAADLIGMPSSEQQRLGARSRHRSSALMKSDGQSESQGCK
jgi:hypothetical protein